jgi:hypothetical protein
VNSFHHTWIKPAPNFQQHEFTIKGDAFILKINDIWVMFYLGIFWPDREESDANNRFAVSNDLMSWVDGDGEDLIRPTEDFDSRFAHKSFVLKYGGGWYITFTVR